MGDLIRFPNPGRYHGSFDVLQDAVISVIREHGPKAAISALKMQVTAVTIWSEMDDLERAIADIEAIRAKHRDVCGND